MTSGAVTISPGGTPVVLQTTPIVTNSHPVKVIVIVPVLGPVTSPLPLSALQVITAFLTVSSVVMPLLDVKGVGNGPVNSGNAADADAVAPAPSASMAIQQRPSVLTRVISDGSFAVALDRCPSAPRKHRSRGASSALEASEYAVSIRQRRSLPSWLRHRHGSPLWPRPPRGCIQANGANQSIPLG